ncbi:MAG TPA: enoyl-CoA hydratase-related protein [Zeimonas sp.]
MNENEIVQYVVDDGIAVITLNRPERRNALSIAAAERLHALWSELDRDPAVRVGVLTSADCGTFCAGMDLKETAEIRRERGVDILDVLSDPFYERMRTVGKPIIAAMTGHFAAGGMMLCLNSDLRVGLAGTRGGVTEAKIGRGSPWAVPLLWMLPQPVVAEMLLTGEMMPVERLHALGFVNYVESTPEAVRARAMVLARTIRDNAPLTVLAGKEAILRAMDLGCAAGFERAKSIYRKVYASEDAQEGPRAFAEKRKPVWVGR